MKVAIVQDWLVINGGAEKVLRCMLEVFPNADVYSLVDFLDDKNRNEILLGKQAKTSFIQKLPFSNPYFRYYLPFFINAIEKFDFTKYDIILSSSYAFSKGVKKKFPEQIHICYCHSPFKQAWIFEEEYTKSYNLSGIKKWYVNRTLQKIRDWDIKTLDRVDYFIANSKYISDRIKKIYNRNAEIIYPPVNTDKFSLCIEKHDYYITVSRMVPYKKIDIIIEAFNILNKKLIVVGEGIQLDSNKKLAKHNVEVVGYKSDEELVQLIQNAKGFVFAALEDFGIVPLEAQSCGTPAIALGEGGTSETIIDKKTGIHFKKQNIKSIIDAIHEFEAIKFNPQQVREQALKFSQDTFKKKLKNYIEKKVLMHGK